MPKHKKVTEPAVDETAAPIVETAEVKHEVKHRAHKAKAEHVEPIAPVEVAVEVPALVEVPEVIEAEEPIEATPVVATVSPVVAPEEPAPLEPGAPIVIDAPVHTEAVAEPAKQTNAEAAVEAHLARLANQRKFADIFASGKPFTIKSRGQVVFNTLTHRARPQAAFDHVFIYGIKYSYAGLEVVTA